MSFMFRLSDGVQVGLGFGVCSLHCGSVKVSPQYLIAVLLVRLESPFGGVFSIIMISRL